VHRSRHLDPAADGERSHEVYVRSFFERKFETFPIT